MKIWEVQIFQPRLPGVLDARALLDLSRGTALKIFVENVYENENSKKLIISDKEDIEKVGDVGKEVGREALGNV